MKTLLILFILTLLPIGLRPQIISQGKMSVSEASKALDAMPDSADYEVRLLPLGQSNDCFIGPWRLIFADGTIGRVTDSGIVVECDHVDTVYVHDTVYVAAKKHCEHDNALKELLYWWSRNRKQLMSNDSANIYQLYLKGHTR